MWVSKGGRKTVDRQKMEDEVGAEGKSPDYVEYKVRRKGVVFVVFFIF